jgi:four helix bundle protein
LRFGFQLFSFPDFRFSPRMSRTSDDLRDRTKQYASAVVRLYVDLPKRREEVRILGHQLLTSGTSVASNFREASRARSRAEFISKIETCAQEADESDLWLQLLGDERAITTDQLAELLAETNELISIFVTMARRSKDNLESRTIESWRCETTHSPNPIPLPRFTV